MTSRRLKSDFPRLLLFAFLSVLFLKNSWSNPDTSKEMLTKQQLDQVSQKIANVQKQLNSDKSSQKKEQDALKQSEIELGKLRVRMQALNDKRREIRKRITILTNEENILNDKNNSQKTALNKDLRNIYTIGRQEKLKLLLNQENPEEIARILRYYDYYTSARVERIRDYQENIKQIAIKRQAIELELTALEQVEHELQKETEHLNNQQQERQKIITQLNKNIRSQDEQLRTLRADQNRLTKLLESLQNIWADLPHKLDSTPISKNRGKLKPPVEGRIRHHFGAQRADGRLRWNGVLIGAPMEHPVRAIHDGRVVFSDWIRGYGLLIIVDHSEGYLSLYGHNASLLKEAGDWIRAGEALATVGNSGGQYETGLYFEMRKDGTPLNPRQWMQF